jgi:hypothetical protein
MWLRCCVAALVALGLAACSANSPFAGAVDGTSTVAGAVPEPKPAKPPRKSKLRCQTVLGEVEGFGKESVRATAETSRLKAIATETVHRKSIGQTVASVDLEATECVAVYPIGAEEWHCMARAKVCAAG